MKTKEKYGYKLSDFEMLQKLAKRLGLHLAIDNNIDGVRRLARYNKSFLSRKLNAAGVATVFLLRPGFLTWNEKLICEYNFEE